MEIRILIFCAFKAVIFLVKCQLLIFGLDIKSQGQLFSYSDVYFANLLKNEIEQKSNSKILVIINLRVHKYKVM